MKFKCSNCNGSFIDSPQEGSGLVIGVVCPYCKTPINVPVSIYKPKEVDNGEE